MNYLYNTDVLYHHGILGMKWGVRRYKNANGTLTAKGIRANEKIATYERVANDNYAQSIKRANTADSSNFFGRSYNNRSGSYNYENAVRYDNKAANLRKKLSEEKALKVDKNTELSKNRTMAGKKYVEKKASVYAVESVGSLLAAGAMAVGMSYALGTTAIGVAPAPSLYTRRKD